jgi:hypothetical protein
MCFVRVDVAVSWSIDSSVGSLIHPRRQFRSNTDPTPNRAFLITFKNPKFFIEKYLITSFAK